MSAQAKSGKQKNIYRDTLFLPQTAFPMKAGLPALEKELLARWERIHLYRRMREKAEGRDLFILHDGPPYANGPLHLGTALNKILKDIINRSQHMMGKNAVYVPGWDCHGLPIEWQVEEEYRKKGKARARFPRKNSDAAAANSPSIGLTSKEINFAVWAWKAIGRILTSP